MLADSTVDGQESAIAASARYIGQVIDKLADGTYPTEAVRCACGADFHDLPITQHDRYFIPHRMVLCLECSLIRATPRMTAEAYRQFYNTEYRPIYDRWQFGERGQDDEFVFMRQADGGVNFKAFMDYFGIAPKSVIDIGCNMGGTLLPFQEAGATVLGADLCAHSVEVGRQHQIPMLHGGLDELIAQGVTADLVIMQDFVEHLLDLDDLRKVGKLLAPKGILYVGTPGLFKFNLATLFQNAHTYQFIGETLAYVMGQYGFEPLYLDEDIASLWRLHDAPIEVQKPAKWRTYIFEHLQQKPLRLMPPIRCINKFPVPELRQNIETNLSYRRPDLRELVGTKSGPVIIVGGGPSVDGQVETIKSKKAEGAALLVIERMYPWCQTVGLTPDYVISLDCSEGVEAGFTAIQPETIHLLSTATRPSVFQLLKDHQVYVFSGASSTAMDIQDLWAKYGYTQTTLINGGGSVTLAAMAVAMTLGFRNIHLFGFDCMVQPGQMYASGIAGQSVDRQYFEVEIDGQTYTTCASFASFAQQFFNMANLGRKMKLLESIDVYGESLVNVMWDKGVSHG